MGSHNDINTNAGIESTFNSVGLTNHEGSLVGQTVIPNGSANPKDEFGTGYDFEYHHRNLCLSSSFGGAQLPVLTVTQDYEKNGNRFLSVKNEEGKTGDVLASRLILAQS